MTSRKRPNQDVLVDPEAGAEIEDPKKPKIDLNVSHKIKCLTAIQQAFLAFTHKIFAPAGTQMETDTVHPAVEAARENIHVGNHIASIIFTLHNVLRQKAKEPGTTRNMEAKTKTTSFKVVVGRGDYTITYNSALLVWRTIVGDQGLEYKNFTPDNGENWYGTMGPYIDMFCAFSLRMNELRLGHNNFPVSKVDGKHKSFPVSKYGLSGAHHVLLEGASFPPERRSSIVQSLGPMTVWLCMLRSEGVYRKKYASAVKRAMAHIPGIDDIIEITKNTKMASEVSSLTTLLAEILLITTARQATRIFLPLTMFAKVATDENIPAFNTTGKGGWFLYKLACEHKFTLNSAMEQEMAQQVVFHSIFGTYREDLGVLSAVTTQASWYTREELGQCFIRPETNYTPVRFSPIKVTLYSKMSCANQTGLLSGIYNQVATVPAFSGKRIHVYDKDFFDHIEKKKTLGSIGKTLPQILSSLTSTLEELHDMLKKADGQVLMGTTKWRKMESLTLTDHGEETDTIVRGTGKKFLGRSKK